MHSFGEEILYNKAMHLKISLLILLIPFSIFAQSHRFLYSYQFVPDSAKADSVITELTRLDVFADHSEFLSDVTAKKDSAIAFAINNNQSQANIKLPDGIYQNKTSKTKELTSTIEYIGIQPFKIEMKNSFKWQLSKETKTIEGYLCQKANLHYGGRIWEAWFTREIPVQQGPYVFSGLPGIIVQISDTKNHHTFTLKANYKIPAGSTGIYTQPYFVPVKIDAKSFNKKWNDYRKQPLGGTEQFMQMNPGLLSGESYDQNGNKSLIIERTRQEREYAKKQLDHNNNYINLELYSISLK